MIRINRTFAIAVLAIVAGAALVIGGVIGTIAGYAIAKPADANKASGKSAKPLTRDEFRTLVMGQSREEVLRLAGKPKFTTLTSEETWYYAYPCYDPVTGNADSSVPVRFNASGRCVGVDF